MSDEDRAQAVELAEWERNNQSRPEPVKFEPGEDGYGPAYCVDVYCDAEMPAQRRAWGYTVCVDCQTKKEQARQRGR